MDTTNVAGNPAPLPDASPSGTTPPMTPSGAAAATTMKTIDATPRFPRRWRTGVGGFCPKVSGVVVISDIVTVLPMTACWWIPRAIEVTCCATPHLESP